MFSKAGIIELHAATHERLDLCCAMLQPCLIVSITS
jgi:hypothetical protein